MEASIAPGSITVKFDVGDDVEHVIAAAQDEGIEAHEDERHPGIIVASGPKAKLRSFLQVWGYDPDEMDAFGESPSPDRPEAGPNHGMNEKYIGFKKLKGKLAGKKGVRNPGALAAAIGRKKYGSKGMAAKSAAGRRK